MFYSCAKLKLSTTQTGNYTTAYRIPKSGTGTTATDALANMFSGTGGTFTGTPSINTTYYLDAEETCLTFESDEPFSLATRGRGKGWNGTIQYY